MKYLSLFSGIGGFELGITQAYESNHEHAPVGEESEQEKRSQGRVGATDFDGTLLHDRNGSTPLCVGYSEIDKYAVQIYQSHFPEHKNYGDITKIKAEDLPQFDLLVGGFPCQAFSIAGKRGGFRDTRGTLFFEIARILKAKQPRLFLLENVKGLLSHDEGRTFRTIIATLDELGYDVQWQVLNSKNFGVPQNRERVFIVGHLRGTSRPEVFPFGEVNEKNYAESQLHNRCELLEGDGSESLSKEESETDSHAVRRLTPTECERLQGFPDGWTLVGTTLRDDEYDNPIDAREMHPISDTQRYKTLGNAVTVNVIQAIISRLTP